MLPKEEFLSRIEKITPLLKEAGISTLVISGFRNFWRDFYVRYLTGYDLHGPIDLLIMPLDEEPTLLISEKSDLYRAKKVSWVEDIRYSSDFASDCNAVLKKHISKKRSIGFAGGEMMGIKGFNFIPADLYNGIRSSFPNADFVEATDILDKVRMIKSEREKELLRNTAKIAQAGCEALFRTAGEGISEREIFSEIWYAMQKNGAEDLHLSMTTGMPNFWIRPPTERVLEEGDLIVAEICPRVEGYFIQTIKMAVVGEVKREYEDLFAIEKSALEAGLEQVKPGNKIKDIVNAANDIVKNSGIGTLDMGQGMIRAGHAGGIGLDESPPLTITNELEIQEDMSLIVHPVSFFPYIGSVFFIGDHTLVKSDGAEILTTHQEQLISV